MLTAEEIIKRLQLMPHPCEGGHFRQTYRSSLTISSSALPRDYVGERVVSTAIYYLLTPGQFSEMHRLTSDEVFHFYRGDAVEMLQLHPRGSGEVIRIGSNLEAGELPQVLAPAGVWQGTRLLPGGQFALLGCTVAPGFEYADYSSGRRDELIVAFPGFTSMITALTHR
jgi:predicted cupin superfamily sugar epimerase